MSTRASRRGDARTPAARRAGRSDHAIAREVFCDKGYAQASTAEIAAQVGVVEGTLYRYFPSKRQLLLGVIEAFYESIFADYEQQLQGVRGTWNRLRFLIWKHLECPSRRSGHVSVDRP